MSEPKKETVRIVLPPRQGGAPGAPLAANPREKAMSNLPAKPVPVPPGGSTPAIPKPPGSVAPGAPSIPKPPAPASGIPSIPKPPGGAGIPKPPGSTIPKPPGAPAAPIAPVAPKPPGSAAAAISRPAAAAGGGAPVAPQPLKPEAKKETAKVQPGVVTAKLPQATVKLQKPSQPGTVSANINVPAISQAPAPAPAEELSPVLGVAALVAALLALGVQLWTMI